MKATLTTLLGAAVVLLGSLTTIHAGGKGSGGGGGGGGKGGGGGDDGGGLGDDTTTPRIAIQAPVVTNPRSGKTSLEVVALEPDGSTATQLTDNAASASWPAWSKSYEYLSYCSGGWIYVQEVKTGNRFAVTPAKTGGHDWWSDDGGFVYTGTEAMGYGIWFVSVDPATGAVGEPVLLREGQCLEPQVSPDGTQIAYWCVGGQIMVLDWQAGVETEFAGNPGYSPKWNADGSKILFSGTVCYLEEDGSIVCHREIVISDPDGTNRVPVTALRDRAYYPMFSPDGTEVAFHSSVSGSWALYMTTIGSGSMTLLHENAEPWGGDWAP
ncbi:MAG: hypothetical protein GWO24_18120 [Akkermansiaceae bacterium]|nr:hypothetical protein [Akkermansiaceae bacterium]